MTSGELLDIPSRKTNPCTGSTCYSNDQFGGYGMDWFDAMQCCYYQGGYLAEPQNAEETEKINTYLTICRYSHYNSPVN